jgi:hypothetical protein
MTGRLQAIRMISSVIPEPGDIPHRASSFPAATPQRRRGIFGSQESRTACRSRDRLACRACQRKRRQLASKHCQNCESSFLRLTAHLSPPTHRADRVHPGFALVLCYCCQPWDNAPWWLDVRQHYGKAPTAFHSITQQSPPGKILGCSSS